MITILDLIQSTKISKSGNLLGFLLRCHPDKVAHKVLLSLGVLPVPSAPSALPPQPRLHSPSLSVLLKLLPFHASYTKQLN